VNTNILKKSLKVTVIVKLREIEAKKEGWVI
jgi:hypothetical protein